jgi:hypothetical protein
MTDLPELRASDADRERLALQLREHAVQGRLTLEEFSERMEKAYLAKTIGELDELGGDLPAENTPRSPGRAERFTGVVFGDVQRKGRWRVGRSGFALAALGNLDLDLRQAELGAPDASITAFVLFGNIDFYVPQGVEVDVGGLSVFGHRRDWGDDPPRRPDAPLLRVRVFSLFGTADIWRVPSELAGAGLREVIGALRHRRDALPPG